MSFQSRRWCFTWNDYPEEWDLDHTTIPDHAGDLVEGGVAGFETAPTTGQRHLQGYVFLKKKITLKGLKTYWVNQYPDTNANTVHWESAKGNTKQAVDYCEKGGVFVKWGTFPRDGYSDDTAESKKRKGHDYGVALQLAKEGDLGQIHPELLVKHYKAFKEIASDSKDKPEDLVGGRNFIIYGRSGYGKSYAARHVYNEGREVYTKDWTKWWPAYAGQQCVVLDDLSPEHARGISDLLKIWGDCYPFNAEVKGGSTGWIRPERFIITTQYKLEELFRDKRTHDAISRRFQFVELTYKWDDPRAASGPGFVLPPVPSSAGQGPHGADMAMDGVVQPTSSATSQSLHSLEFADLIDLARDCNPFDPKNSIDEFEGYWN